MKPPTYRIDLDASLPPDEKADLFLFFEEQFARIDGEPPANQSLTKEELQTLLQSSACFTITCRRDERDLVGAMVITTDLGDVAWANTEFFAKTYSLGPEPIPMFFVASLAVDPDAPRQVLNGLIDRLTDIVADASGVAVADLRDEECEYSLARHIATRVAMRYQSDWRALGSQTYHAFRPGRPIEPISWASARRRLTDDPIGPPAVKG